MNDRRYNAFLAGGFSSVAGVAVSCLCLRNPLKGMIRGFAGNTNLCSLLIGFASFTVLFLITNYFMVHHSSRSILHRSSRGSRLLGYTIGACYLCFLVAALYFEAGTFAAEGETTAFLNIHLITRTCILLFGAFLLCSELKHQNLLTRNFPYSKLIFCFLTLLFAVIGFNNLYQTDLGYTFNRHHFHAYFNSIYNLFWGVPFSGDVASIYGHYAFFYVPILKAAVSYLKLVSLVKGVMLLAALLVSISICIYGYAIWNLVKTDFLRFVGLIAASYTILSKYHAVYLQGTPHRAFVFAAILLMMVFWYKCSPRKRPVMAVFGFVVSALLIIWNTEFGLFAAAAWAALLCCHCIQEKGAKSWRNVFLSVLGIPCAFWVAWQGTSLLNILIGGSRLSFLDFICPLANQTYMVDVLEADLLLAPAWWMCIVAGLFIAMALGLSTTAIISPCPERNPADAVLFGLSVMGLGMVTYGMNRPAFGNFYLVMPVMAIIMCFLAEMSTPQICLLLGKAEHRHKLKAGNILIGILGLGTLCILCFLTCSGLYNAESNFRYCKSQRSDTWIQQGVLFDIIDDDTVAIGGGVTELYASFNKDTQFHVMDYSDVAIAENFLQYADLKLGKLSQVPVCIERDAQLTHEKYAGPGYAAFLASHRFVREIDFGTTWLYYYVPLEP